MTEIPSGFEPGDRDPTLQQIALINMVGKDRVESGGQVIDFGEMDGIAVPVRKQGERDVSKNRRRLFQ